MVFEKLRKKILGEERFNEIEEDKKESHKFYRQLDKETKEIQRKAYAEEYKKQKEKEAIELAKTGKKEGIKNILEEIGKQSQRMDDYFDNQIKSNNKKEKEVI